MLRFAPLAVMAALATPVVAQDMTPEERTAFRAEVRAYLLENPEVLMEAIGVLEDRQAADARANDVNLVAQNADALFSSDTSFVGGNPDGDFTVVEFLDYRCGYCKRAHPEVAALIDGDTNIRYVIKELPILGEQSVLASRYALAVQQVVGDDAYYDIHNTLMEYQGNITDANLARISDAFGYDHDALADMMNGPEVNAVIAENRALADALAITGTPSFVFEDQMLRGYVPLAQMEQIVAQLRSRDG
ncbi:MAG: DsbA family protein [Yoonia sp.]|uniref:DsbA family protein n=1 Tax=Rhodobacterales TaxID=204455 RepID=UPI001FF16474|nr:DsbA family protein [Loktanella sp. F6476L]MCK0119657.1 DsbA family protein [Loktanella sp. F6476L]UWQ97717.1 DsbA family protein [Rhodobacteraceae bacterium S2214]